MPNNAALFERIRRMPPGFELSELVAVDIIGWRKIELYATPQYYPPWLNLDPHKGPFRDTSKDRGWIIPSFATDIYQAFKVVHELSEHFMFFGVKVRADGAVRAQFTLPAGDDIYGTSEGVGGNATIGAAASLAICRAGLIFKYSIDGGRNE